ncbi:MAG: glycosyltransferase [Merismopedia sp. SIO2A8]|nr:glycosyltransferase [Merismopedia sp. SIO2A8]
MPRVAIIMTVFNREAFLQEAIASFSAQSYTDAQLLVWDDGSTDGSLHIAQSLALKDQRIKVVNAPHLGRAIALKKAVQLTSSEFLGLLDSDDKLAPTAIEDTVALLEREPSVGMVYSQYYEMDIKGSVRGVGKRSLIPFSKDRLLVDFMTFHFRLLRRSVYEQVEGFDPDFVCAQDYDLCLKISEVTQVAHIPKPLYFYRWHNNSVSCQRQLEQIHFSQRAIHNALKRRGLEDKLELEVQLRPQFLIKRKS